MEKELLEDGALIGDLRALPLSFLRTGTRYLPFVFLLLSLVPLLPLLSVHAAFYIDWYNHTWMTGYFGQYFRGHAAMPTVVQTAWAAGMAQPIFYGYLLYPVLGLFGVLFSADLAIRIAILAVMTIQFQAVSKSLRDFKAPQSVALSAACLVNWSIYSMTNLYNRGALTEFFAVALLTSAIALLFSASVEQDAKRRRFLCWSCGLLATLSAGSHPITALFGAPLVAAALGYNYLLTEKRNWLKMLLGLIAPGLLCLMVLAPWVYAVHLYQPKLFISDLWPKLLYYTDSIDSWIARLLPIPYDSRIGKTPLRDISTPYLDAPVNDALLVIAACLGVWIYRKADPGQRKRFLAILTIPAAIFLVCLIFSLIPPIYEYMPQFMNVAQFAYRWVTYVNLAVLLSFYGIVAMGNRVPKGPAIFKSQNLKKCLACAVMLGLTALAIKFHHVWAIIDYNGPVTTDYTNLPPTMYGWQDYSMPSYYAPGPSQPTEVWLPMGQGSDLGDPQPLVLNFQNGTWVGTNVMAFPWNRIFLDSREIPLDQLRNWKEHWRNVYLAVYVPPGRHELTYHFQPDPLWLFLHRLSAMVLLSWVFMLLILWTDARSTVR